MSGLAAMVNQDSSKHASQKTAKSEHARHQISDMQREKTDVEVQNLRQRYEDMELKWQQEREQVAAEKRAKFNVEQEHKKKVQ